MSGQQNGPVRTDYDALACTEAYPLKIPGSGNQMQCHSIDDVG
jgi:hypothetical protein